MAIFSIFFNMKVFCVFSLESLRRGDSYEYTQYTIFNIKKKITLFFSQICSYGVLFQGTQERVRNSRSKRAISVRATEVLLYLEALNNFASFNDISLVAKQNLAMYLILKL